MKDTAITHLSLSPIFSLQNPNIVERALGGEQEFMAFVRHLHQEHPNLNLTLDIRPAHLKTGPHNPYWQDLLEKGPHSAYVHWFKIAKKSGFHFQTLAMPFLNTPLEHALEKRQLALGFNLKDGFYIRYGYSALPVSHTSRAMLLDWFLEFVRKQNTLLTKEETELALLLRDFKKSLLQRYPMMDDLKQKLVSWVSRSRVRHREISGFARMVDGQLFRELLKHQYYLLKQIDPAREHQIGVDLQHAVGSVQLQEKLRHLFARSAMLRGVRVQETLPEAYLKPLQETAGQIWRRAEKASLANDINLLFINHDGFRKLDVIHTKINRRYKTLEKALKKRPSLALYRYFPLYSVNDLGLQTRPIQKPVTAFHQANKNRPADSLNEFSSETSLLPFHARHRLNAVSEMAEDFIKARRVLIRLFNRRVDRTTAYLICQYAVALGPTHPQLKELVLETRKRAGQIIDEANLGWAVDQIAAAQIPRFSQLLARVEEISAINSASALALQIFAPGIPVLTPDSLNPFSQSLLALRRRYCELFTKGTYVPLRFAGPQKKHFVAYARQLGEVTVVIAAQRFVALQPNLKLTRLLLPTGWPKEWRNGLENTILGPKPAGIFICDPFFHNMSK